MLRQLLISSAIVSMFADLMKGPQMYRSTAGFPQGTRSPGDRAHKRWKRRRASGRSI